MSFLITFLTKKVFFIMIDDLMKEKLDMRCSKITNNYKFSYFEINKI